MKKEKTKLKMEPTKGQLFLLVFNPFYAGICLVLLFFPNVHEASRITFGLCVVAGVANFIGIYKKINPQPSK